MQLNPFPYQVGVVDNVVVGEGGPLGSACRPLLRQAGDAWPPAPYLLPHFRPRVGEPWNGVSGDGDYCPRSIHSLTTHSQRLSTRPLSTGCWDAEMGRVSHSQSSSEDSVAHQQIPTPGLSFLIS